MNSDRPSNKPQMASSSFRLPALDQDFLLGDSTRGIRFQLEYQKAEESLRGMAVESTIVVFGSARIREGDGNGWYEAARAFAKLSSEKSGARIKQKGFRQNVIEIRELPAWKKHRFITARSLSKDRPPTARPLITNTISGAA